MRVPVEESACEHTERRLSCVHAKDVGRGRDQPCLRLGLGFERRASRMARE